MRACANAGSDARIARARMRSASLNFSARITYAAVFYAARTLRVALSLHDASDRGLW